VPDVPKVDEFAFILLAGVLLIFILAFAWTTPTEGPPAVDETHFEITTDQGETATFDFTISSTTALTSINITAGGEIARWITFNKDDFDIERDESSTVTATLKIPSDVSLGIYRGRITVKGKGGRDTFSVAVDVVEERTETSTRPVSLGDFTVSYAKGTDVLDSREDVRVSNSYLSERTLALTGMITGEKLLIATSGSVHLIIEETNRAGNLIVLINGDEIYNKKVSAGEILIPIDTDLIETSNMVTIRAGSPGWKFWTGVVYKIKKAEFNVDYEGAFSQSFDISMTKNEVDNFKQFNLYFHVLPEGYSVPLPDLMIKVNNQIVYWDSPPLRFFDKSLKEDMFGNPLYLEEGMNTITFEFEEEAFYTPLDAMLTVEYYK